MFKEPRLVEGQQDTYSRKVFVVSPKDCFVQHLIDCDNRLERYAEALYRPAVFFTPEVPFEASLEGYSSGLKRIIRKEFLKRYREDGFKDLPKVSISDGAFVNDDEIAKQFDQWWTIREANNYSEFVDGSWINE